MLMTYANKYAFASSARKKNKEKSNFNRISEFLDPLVVALFEVLGYALMR